MLGNLYRHDGGDLQVYAPVCGFNANRYLLTNAASVKDYLNIFDIDNAFVQALVDSDIFIRLPEIWREENDDGVRKLVKALYGLPQSPRLWAKHYESKLIALGWQQSSERGLWRKPSSVKLGRFLKLGVYVDDNTATGPCEVELGQEVDKILRVFPGKIIEPAKGKDGWVMYDQLGADLWYNQSRGEMQYVMSSYIEKLQSKFGLSNCKCPQTPNFDESFLYAEGEQVQFPLRELIGCLQWVCVVCRPDVCCPVAQLARVASKNCTRTVVNSAKKVLRYLIGTKDVGVVYNAENEEKFKETFNPLASGECKDWNLFTDASFASCFVTLKSVSGAVLYYRGTPIAWKSARQTVRTNSTFESEFVAGSDGLIMSETQTYKGFFEDDYTVEDLWIDNSTAVQVAKMDTDEQRPRSRHVALRYHRVKDFCKNINFCPTEQMKADGLTKNSCTEEVRKNIFYHNPNIVNRAKLNKRIRDGNLESDCDNIETEGYFIESFCYFVDL